MGELDHGIRDPAPEGRAFAVASGRWRVGARRALRPGLVMVRIPNAGSRPLVAVSV